MTELHPLVSRFALNYLDAADQVGEWDRPPNLLIVLDDGTDEPPFAPVDIPEYFWVGRHPIDVIDFLSEQLNRGAVRLIDEHNTSELEGIAGALLVTEAHTIAQERMTESEHEVLNEWLQNHRLEQHPLAKECRLVTAVDRSLNVAAAQHIRDEPIPHDLMYGIEGAVPDGLRRFTTALCANEMARNYTTPTDTPTG